MSSYCLRTATRIRSNSASRSKPRASRKRQLSDWETAHPGVAYDRELFRREILPRLAGVKLSEIMVAASCSKAYASDIRRGKPQPHVSTWSALRRLAEW